MTIFAGRTANGISKQARTHAANPVLHISGLVERPLALTPADLDALPRIPAVDSGPRPDDSTLPETDWSGVSLADLVALAGPQPDARFISVSAGPYAVPLPLADAAQAVLCDRLAGEPLAVDHGGPWRLVVPSLRYNMSVKWVDRLELTADVPDNSAERIAQARARARASAAAKQEPVSEDTSA